MPHTRLASIVDGRRSQPHLLIEVLQDVQKMFGYVSEKSMKVISEELGVPLMEVFSVVSFYKSFSLKPRGKNVITVCMGTACHVRGAKLLSNQAASQLKVEPGETTQDGQFTVEHVNCVGACALGPIVTHNESYHQHMNSAKLRRLIKSHQRADSGGKK